jgi:hypothetical protein
MWDHKFAIIDLLEALAGHSQLPGCVSLNAGAFQEKIKAKCGWQGGKKDFFLIF